MRITRRNERARKRVPRRSLCSLVAAMAVLLPLAQTALSSSQAKEPDSAGRLESFKRFIASPPNIEELVWQKTVAGDSYAGRPSSSAASIPKGTFWFQARWQPDSLFLKSGMDFTVALPRQRHGEEILIRRGDEFWTIDTSGLRLNWIRLTKLLSARGRATFEVFRLIKLGLQISKFSIIRKAPAVFQVQLRRGLLRLHSLEAEESWVVIDKPPASIPGAASDHCSTLSLCWSG